MVAPPRVRQVADRCLARTKLASSPLTLSALASRPLPRPASYSSCFMLLLLSLLPVVWIRYAASLLVRLVPLVLLLLLLLRVLLLFPFSPVPRALRRLYCSCWWFYFYVAWFYVGTIWHLPSSFCCCCIFLLPAFFKLIFRCCWLRDYCCFFCYTVTASTFSRVHLCANPAALAFLLLLLFCLLLLCWFFAALRCGTIVTVITTITNAVLPHTSSSAHPIHYFNCWCCFLCVALFCCAGTFPVLQSLLPLLLLL